jgi:hypothetical protein
MSSTSVRLAVQIVMSLRSVCADPIVPCGFETETRNAFCSIRNGPKQGCPIHSAFRLCPSDQSLVHTVPFSLASAGVNAYLSIYGPGAADPYGLEQNHFFLRNFEEISRNSSNERFEEGAVFLPASTLSSFRRVKETTRVFNCGGVHAGRPQERPRDPGEYKIQLRCFPN